MCIYYNLIIIYIIIRLIPKFFWIFLLSLLSIVLIVLIVFCILFIVFQHINYVYHNDCYIFSMQHLYIVLYCIANFAFTLIFNTLDIEVHYDCYIFSMHRVYSGRFFYTYLTVSYRIHA